MLSDYRVAFGTGDSRPTLSSVEVEGFTHLVVVLLVDRNSSLESAFIHSDLGVTLEALDNSRPFRTQLDAAFRARHNYGH